MPSFAVGGDAVYATDGATFAAALNVTVSVPLEPMTALHGLVVPVQVLGERSA